MTYFDYTEAETDALWTIADKVLTEIERRMEQEDLDYREAEKDAALLRRIFETYEGAEVYQMEITIEDEGFCIEWKTGDNGFVEDWKRTDGGLEVPDKELLKRNPILWLYNLKLGVYEAELV